MATMQEVYLFCELMMTKIYAREAHI